MSTIFDREYEPPEDEAIDGAYAVIHAVAGLLPGGAEVLEPVITPPATRRQREWMQDVAEALRELKARRGITFEELRDNPAFIDAVLTATQAAIRTSQAGKLAALKNATLNAALPDGPEITIQQMFLTLTDRFTDRHLVLLKVFQDASAWRRSDGTALPQTPNATGVLREAFPDARSREDLYKQLWNDLCAAGLVRQAQLENGPEGDARSIKRTTDLGNEYLRFIASPLKP